MHASSGMLHLWKCHSVHSCNSCTKPLGRRSLAKHPYGREFFPFFLSCHHDDITVAAVKGGNISLHISQLVSSKVCFACYSAFSVRNSQIEFVPEGNCADDLSPSKLAWHDGHYVLSGSE